MSGILVYISNHLLMFILSIFLLGLILITSRIRKRNKIILLLITISTIILAISECLEIVFSSAYIHEENIQRYIFSILSYILRPIIIVLFFHLRLDFRNKFNYLIWIGAIINTIIYLLAFLAYKHNNMRFVIWYTYNNVFDRTLLGLTVYFVCGIYVLGLVISSIVDFVINKKNRQIDIFIILTCIVAIIMEILIHALDSQTSYTSELFTIGATLYFIYLNYDKSTTEAIKHEREMQAKTTALMLSQIQPHFIYNTLATIQVLCEIDPEKAAKTIDSFSKYLRMNTDALSKTEPVSILEELKHAMVYSDIEMIRFDNINVTFDIKDKDFKLPVLTLEPILENAIKYGVRFREHGLVEVSTYKEDNMHVLVVKDNGVGFSLDKINDEKNHVGINNVKTRIENMINGTFEINSVVGEGTIVTIKVLEEEA